MKVELFFKELLFFVPTQLVGLLTAVRLKEMLEEVTIVRQEFTAWDVLFFVIFFAAIAVIFRRFSGKASIFFKIFLGTAVFLGSETVYSVLFGSTLDGSILPLVLAAGTVTALFIAQYVIVLNIVVLLGIAGIGAVFGLSITPLTAVALLIILSLYDIIAVYKTKHMVRLAHSMIRSRAIFGFIIPRDWKGYGSKLKEVEPGDRFMILGSGDSAIPLILSVSAATAHMLSNGLIVFFFSVIGLFITHILFVGQPVPRPMAALPPIATMSIIGYVISLLI